MALFTDVTALDCLWYGLAGPGALMVLLGVVWPGRRRGSLVALAAALIACLLLHATIFVDGARILHVVTAEDSSLYALAGLAALVVVLALAALVRPRRALLVPAGLALVVMPLACVWIVDDIRSGILGEFFWRGDAALVRVARDQVAQRLGLPLERNVAALFMASFAALVAAPLLAAASLRARRGPAARPATAWTTFAVALPFVVLAEATLVHVLSCLNRSACAPMGPVDRSPDLVRMWTTLDEQRIVVLAAGLVALAIGVPAAIRLARAGVVASNRRLLAAFAVFLVGAAAYVHTRAHAEDTAAGPRRAFLGQPYRPFAEALPDWTYSDFIDPPDTTPCDPMHDAPTAALVLTAEGEWPVDPADPEDGPRGTAAWERSLRDAIAHELEFADITGRERPPVVAAVIDRAAPIDSVRRYLQIVMRHGVDEITIVARHPDVVATRTLGDVRVDKLCLLGKLRLTAGLEYLDGHATWGAFVHPAHPR